jgi:hypothetical protein
LKLEQGRRRRTHWLLNLVLLPVAILVVLVEDVVWAGARAALRAADGLAPVRRARAWLTTLSGYAALPLFLVPELLGRVGEIWAVALLVEGHVVSGVTVYALVRLVATLVAVFIYQTCERALLQIGWFAHAVGWVRSARNWAVGIIRPAMARARLALRIGRSRSSTRLAAMHRVLQQRLRRGRWR